MSGVPTAAGLVLVVPGPGPQPPDLSGDDVHAALPRLPDGTTAWAHRLHEHLASRAQPPGVDDVATVASWLRVQAVGCRTVAVVDRDCETFRGLWAAAAMAAGFTTVELVDGGPSGGPRRPVPLAALEVPDEPPVRRPTRGSQVRDWVNDRLEGIARRAVRAVQR
jgi:hypothetical protein